MTDQNTSPESGQEISTEEARQAQRAPGLIWVLAGGVILAIIGFAISTVFLGS